MEVFLVKQAYDQLKESIEDLVAKLPSAVDGFVADRPGPFSYGPEAIAKASKGYSELFYGDGPEDGRHTKVWIGALGVTEEHIELARRVNACKDHLRYTILALREKTQESRKKCGPHGAMKSFRRELSETDIGLERLSLRQAYRHIPILEQSPFSIRFSKSKGGRSIKRVKVGKAMKMLDDLAIQGIDTKISRDKISQYPEDYELAQVQRQAPYFKANIRLRGEEGNKEFFTIPVFLPILYLVEEGDKPRTPESLADLNLKPRKKTRPDTKIAEEPLIAALRLHDYLPSQ